MALTPTTSIPLGFKAPEFSLFDVISEKQLRFEDVRGEKGTLVMFICNHCPYVIHVRAELVQLAEDYMQRGIGVVAISSNDVNAYPEDGPSFMKKVAKNAGFPFPYLYDEDQSVAKAYDAACTPDYAVFDREDRCVYRGELDGARPGNRVPNDGKAMRKVLDLLIAGESVPGEGQKPSMGCSIKWK